MRSTLVKFQRMRGVLRLMAAQFELTRYISDNWVPIIEKDVDGPSSLPLKIDREQPNLGKLYATRRVARTIYLGSAPCPRSGLARGSPPRQGPGLAEA